jgi:hypothetical protein
MDEVTLKCPLCGGRLVRCGEMLGGFVPAAELILMLEKNDG